MLALCRGTCMMSLHCPSGPVRFTFLNKVSKAQIGRWYDSGTEGGIPVPVGRQILFQNLAQLMSSPSCCGLKSELSGPLRTSTPKCVLTRTLQWHLTSCARAHFSCPSTAQTVLIARLASLSRVSFHCLEASLTCPTPCLLSICL